MDAGGCFERALVLLTRRPHFTAELVRKLRQKGFSEQATKEAVARCQRLGYLDERAAVEGFVSQRMRRGPCGTARLRADLLARGAMADVVEGFLRDRCSEATELEAAREAAARWCRRNHLDTQRLARHLNGRGFASHVILSVLDSCGTEAVESADGS